VFKLKTNFNVERKKYAKVDYLLNDMFSRNYILLNCCYGRCKWTYRLSHDMLSFDNKVPRRNPLFKEKAEFKNVDIFQIGVNAKTTLGCNFYGRAEATFGWVLDGEVERKASLRQRVFDDYSNGFERVDEQKHKNLIDDRYVYDINAAVGYPFYFCDYTTVVAPVVGYAFNSQTFCGYDNFAFNPDNCSSAETSCCKRSLLTRWYGPFVGVDMNYRACNDSWNFFGAVEYHFGRLKTRRSVDNSINDRFSTHSNMDGWVVNVGADKEINDQWTVGLYFKYSDFTGSKNQRWFADASSDDSSIDSGLKGKA